MFWSKEEGCWGGIPETLMFQRLKHAVSGTRGKGWKAKEVAAHIRMKSC